MKHEYEILEAKGARALVGALNSMDSRWEPVGGPTVVAGTFYQLVRRTPEPAIAPTQVSPPEREEA